VQNPPIISIVDDDGHVRVSLDSLVRSMGFVSRTYACAEDFLASTSCETTSCLISDIRMPGMSGLQLCEQLRVRKVGYPVIFITACVGETPEQRARELGAAGYFKKPFDSNELMERVQQVLNNAAN